jgi:multiple antibiotic resistance protein
VYRALVSAGEQSGDLALVMSRLADYIESRTALAQRVLLAFTYPAIVTVVAMLVIVAMLAYVVPQVVSVFAQTRQELPALTIGLIATSDFVRHWGLLVLVLGAFLGEALLALIGASLPSFRVGGGLVLLLMALAMLNAEVGAVRHTAAETQELESGDVSGVVPLAVPLLAGPGAISTTIIAAQAGGFLHRIVIVVGISVVAALTWFVLSRAEWIAARMSLTAMNVATRILGLLLAAMAVHTMAEGLRELFPGLQ